MSVMSSGYSGRNVFFHGLPQSSIVSGAPSVDDAIRMAGLDWTVGIEPVYQTKRDGSVIQVDSKYFTVREDTETVLGVVGKQYAPFQNAEAFEFANELLGFGVEFDAAGSWDDSKKIFLTAKLPEGIDVAGEDKHDLYLLFRSTHDGSGAISAVVTPVRLSCTNMLSMALKGAVSKWSCRHTRTASDRVAEAGRTLRIVDQYKAQFSEVAEQLLAVEMNLAEFENFVKEVTAAERLQKGMVNTWKESPTVTRGNGWGALNAVSEYYEHLRGGRGNAETRFDSLVDGQASTARNRAAQLLLTR